ncbi:hypothetical protein GGS21DRAFT_497565 [Xylaria nigripes]|nr:hypothetical protein GGS21DRAFT_497565 [Xylaria nigripes]
MQFVHYWIIPVISGLVWLATLLALFLYWVVNTHETIYPSMESGQTIAFISDVGASNLKPLFVTGSILTTVLLDVSFIADRVLRHKARLVPNTTLNQKIASGLSIFFALIGTIGLTFLSGFDTAHYPRLHDIFLILFIGGYVLSAICLCWEFYRLSRKYHQHRILRISFWIKLTFVIVELALAIGFLTLNNGSSRNQAAYLEWILALIFSFYVFSFAIDLWPAVPTKDGRRYDLRPMTRLEMEEAVQRGSFADAAAARRPVNILDSERTLTNYAPRPSVLAPTHKKPRGAAENF